MGFVILTRICVVLSLDSRLKAEVLQVEVQSPSGILRLEEVMKQILFVKYFRKIDIAAI